MAQWEAAVRLLSKRDAEIEGVALEIERYICTTKVMTYQESADRLFSKKEAETFPGSGSSL